MKDSRLDRAQRAFEDLGDLFVTETLTEPQHQGFGSTLLQRVLPMQCNGDVEVQFNREGLRFIMNVPLIEQRLVPAY